MKVKFLIRLETEGAWGSWERGFEAHVTTVKDGAGRPFVPPTYLKGLIRRNVVSLIDHLERLNVISRRDIALVFGPSPFEDSGDPPTTRPSPIRVSAGKIVTEREAEMIRASWPDPDDLVEGGTIPLFVEHHVRVRDETRSVSHGALFTEERVEPGSYLYGCVDLGGLEQSLAERVACSIVLALLNAAYTGVGRRTVGTVCVRVEGFPRDSPLAGVIEVAERMCGVDQP